MTINHVKDIRETFNFVSQVNAEVNAKPGVLQTQIALGI